MQEIGGYLELENLVRKPYHTKLIELNLGRQALMYLVFAKNIKKIYLPYYLCDSVNIALDLNNIDYEYYNIGYDFKPIFKKSTQPNEYVYIVNYYGQFNNNEILKFKKQFKNIILDNTQSFFQIPIEGIDTIYSVRKYFGVPDGAYLYTNSSINFELKTDKSIHRINHLIGRLEENASKYYDDFKKTDDSFKHEPLKSMSILTKNILGAIDYDQVIKKRNRNYEYLHRNLKSINFLEVCHSKAPFAYPLYVKNADIIRDILASKNVYIPILWPNAIGNSDYVIEKDLASNILPIPCDQRYEIEDMKRIYALISQLL